MSVENVCGVSSVGSPTAETLSSSQSRPDNEFETDRSARVATSLRLHAGQFDAPVDDPKHPGECRQGAQRAEVAVDGARRHAGLFEMTPEVQHRFMS